MSSYTKPQILYLDIDPTESPFHHTYETEPYIPALFDTYVNKSYTEIPHVFTTYDKWIKSAQDISCWHCTLKIITVPVPIPTYCRYKNNKVEFDVMGLACSFPCAEAYIHIYIQGAMQNKYHDFLRSLFYYFKGYEVNYIPRAPSKILLKKFGGEMTKNEYRKEIDKLSNQCIVNTLIPE